MGTLITNNMDDEGSRQKENINHSSDGGDVPKPIGVRCPILHGIEDNRKFLCNYHLYFLPIISFIIWFVFLLN